MTVEQTGCWLGLGGGKADLQLVRKYVYIKWKGRG